LKFEQFYELIKAAFVYEQQVNSQRNG